MISGEDRRKFEAFVRRVETVLIYIDRPHSPTAISIREGLKEIKEYLGMPEGVFRR